MARNRQRAKDRKRRKQGDGPVEPEHSSEELDDAVTPTDDAPDPELGSSQALVPDEPVDDDEYDVDDEVAGDGSSDDGDDGGDAPVAVSDAGGSAPARKQGPLKRFAAFLRASWAELQRVQWPDRRQVGQATTVVLGFVVLAGIFLGLSDAAAKELVDIIL